MVSGPWSNSNHQGLRSWIGLEFDRFNFCMGPVPGGSCTARKLRDLQCAGSPHGASMIIFTPAAPSGFRSSFPGRKMTWSFTSSTGDGLRLYVSVSSCVATCFPLSHWHTCQHLSFPHIPVVLFSITSALRVSLQTIDYRCGATLISNKQRNRAVGTQAAWVHDLIRISQYHRNPEDLATCDCTG